MIKYIPVLIASHQDLRNDADWSVLIAYLCLVIVPIPLVLFSLSLFFKSGERLRHPLNMGALAIVTLLPLLKYAVSKVLFSKEIDTYLFFFILLMGVPILTIIQLDFLFNRPRHKRKRW
jgi:hypothetical protein